MKSFPVIRFRTESFISHTCGDFNPSNIKISQPFYNMTRKKYQRKGTKEWPPYSIKIRTFFEFYQTLWHIIISKKLILVKTSCKKLI